MDIEETSENPNFSDLADRYPSLAPFVRKDRTGAPHIEFGDPRALRELCYAIMWLDHGIRIEFPLDSLIPTVRGRLDYVEWVRNLPGLGDDHGNGTEEGKQRRSKKANAKKRKTWGIDIGVGCSCIYPLLGCATNEDWSFFGTDVDPRSIEYAEDNVKRNGLEERIILKLNASAGSSSILPATLLPGDITTFDFLLCNPPFYSHAADFQPKANAASGINSGTANESITEGGEIAFVLKLIEESKALADRVTWWTSLIGKKQSLDHVLGALRSGGAEYQVGQFRPGQTTRWAVAWRWQGFGSSK